MGTGAAIVGAGALGLWGASKSAKAQSKAAGKAADVSLASTQMQVEAQLKMFYKALEVGAPFREQELALGQIAVDSARSAFEQQRFLQPYTRAAVESLARQPGLLRAEAERLGTEDDPVYQMQKREVQKSLASRGLRTSGRGVMEETGLVASEALRVQGARERLGMRAEAIEGGLASAGGRQITAPAPTMASSAAGAATATGQGMAQAQRFGAAGQMQGLYAQGQSQAMFYQGMSRLPWQMASMYNVLT
jgi:hypothetical protein